MLKDYRITIRSKNDGTLISTRPWKTYALAQAELDELFSSGKIKKPKTPWRKR